MNDSKLKRELGRQLREFKFEVGDKGELLFQGSGLQLGGIFSFENLTRGDGVVYAYNRVVLQGRNHILDVILGNAAKIATWHIAPFAGNVTPQDNLTAATFASTTTEFVFYEEVARQAFTESGTATGGVLGNLSDRAEIVVGGGGSPQDTIHGLGILSASGKGSTSGVLLSAARLPSARTNLQVGDNLALGYQLTLTDAS